MNDNSPSVSLPNIVALLRRHHLLIVLSVALAVGASLGLSAATDPTYTTAAQIAFNDDSGDLQAIGIPASPSFQPDKEAAAQAERITRPEVIATVRRDLGIKLSDDEIRSSVATRVEVTSNLVSIEAESGTAKLAAGLANGFARAIRRDANSRARERFRGVARISQRRAASLKGERNAARRAVYDDQANRLLALAAFAAPVDIVRSASEPDSPSSPKPVRNAALAGLVGLMLALGLAFLRQSFDRRLREPEDVEREFDAPIVGLIRTAALGRTPIPSTDNPLVRDEDVEPFRILRTNLALLAPEVGVKSILVSSPLSDEGKSTVAAGLAWAEALTGRRTLIVDCDLRRPTLAGRLGLDHSPGLTEFLLGEAQPADILRTVAISASSDVGGPQLVCIPAGRAVVNHAELLGSLRFSQFLEQVSGVYDRIILDTAPLLPVSDTLELLPHVDGILLCLRLGQTTRDDAHAVHAALERVSGKPLGVVLTAADTSQSPYYAGSYAYSPAAEPAR